MMFGELPFEYVWYVDAKDIPMSDELKAEFKALADRIKSTKSVEDFPSLQETFEVLRKKYVAEISKVDKKAVYTKQLREFIFWGIYHLLGTPAGAGKERQMKTISQAKAGEVFGLCRERIDKPQDGKSKYHYDKLEKYDLYPRSSYKAFTKDNYISMIPNKTETEGIEIARFLNQKVLAPHACRKVIAVTNDLDVLANIESPDKKKYIMMMDLSDSVMSYARYLFANGNRNRDANGKRIPPSKIKEQICKLLQKDDNSLIGDTLKVALLQDENIAKYFKGYEDILEDFLRYKEAEEYFRSFLESEYEQAEDSEDDMGTVPLYNELYTDDVSDLDYNDKYQTLLDKAIDEANNAYYDLLEHFPVKKYFEDNENALGCYLIAAVEEFKKIEVANLSSQTEQAAALYWLHSVVNTVKSLGTLTEWLKTKELLRYFDALTQETGTGHLELAIDTIDWESLLSDEYSRPSLIYIDKRSYKVTATELAYLTSRGIVVVTDEKGETYKL